MDSCNTRKETSERQDKKTSNDESYERKQHDTAAGLQNLFYKWRHIMNGVCMEELEEEATLKFSDDKEDSDVVNLREVCLLVCFVDLVLSSIVLFPTS